MQYSTIAAMQPGALPRQEAVEETSAGAKPLDARAKREGGSLCGEGLIVAGRHAPWEISMGHAQLVRRRLLRSGPTWVQKAAAL